VCPFRAALLFSNYRSLVLDPQDLWTGALSTQPEGREAALANGHLFLPPLPKGRTRINYEVILSVFYRKENERWRVPRNAPIASGRRKSLSYVSGADKEDTDEK
jgi:hypothetical protein